jgi:hypothetical protein
MAAAESAWRSSLAQTTIADLAATVAELVRDEDEVAVRSWLSA